MSYQQSAIETIYRKDDDLLIIGLTGRTGSGCSTVAKILCSPKESINHSLFKGNKPGGNDDRKSKIIYNHYNSTWRQFELIQVRSILTLFLLQDGFNTAAMKLKEAFPGHESRIDAAAIYLEGIQTMHDRIDEKNDPGGAIDFYTKALPSACSDLKEALGENLFIKLYQVVGRNIRHSGKPFDATRQEGKFFTLAEKINAILKIIISANKSLKRSTLVVIDAIRSPLEAIFFQDRYAAFYLAAVSCPNDERIKRLHSLGLSVDQIAAIDSEEYSSRDLDNPETYSVQDIQACLQRADVYISNHDVPNKVSEFQGLANQLIRLVSLMKHPGLVTPNAVERCMQLAHTAKLNSGCISRQVGATITDENFSVQAIGWNDAPRGHVPCNLRNREDLTAGEDQSAYSEYERKTEKFLNQIRQNTPKYIHIKNTGRNLSYCFKSEYNILTGKPNQVHTRSLHAEENAFLQLSKYGGRGIAGGYLFTTASPCELCAKKAYQLGVTKIYYIDPYPGIALTHILEGGTTNPELILFSGAIGRAFHRLFTPILPYKDELTALAKMDTVNALTNDAQ
ncbi:hypothetical protein E7V67_015435 [[Empedobacter] haloabium]|uniref:CMP/dCMP-type deaminase domain-containing protein n=1 Tax=[Empedobacter] haloabium TaxID=592317 RepID=A0ABZ1UE65_9BURK